MKALLHHVCTTKTIIQTMWSAIVLGFSFHVFGTHGMIQPSLAASRALANFGRNRCWTRFLPNSPDGIPGASQEVPPFREAQSVFKEKEAVFQGPHDNIVFWLLVQQIIANGFHCPSLIAKTLYPDSPGTQSIPQLWKSLRSHWAKPGETQRRRME